VADENDDLLDPAEIEALLNAQFSAPPPSSTPPESPPQSADPAGGGTDEIGEVLSQQELDKLFQQKARSTPARDPQLGAARKTHPRRAGAGAAGRSAEDLLNQVEADLAAALSGESKPSRSLLSDFGDASPFQFQAFEPARTSDVAANLDSLNEVELDLRIELGRTELLIEEVLKLREGSVVPLDKLAGDPVDILVNGRLVARGEVLVLNDNFCVRVAEILTPSF